MQNEVGGCARNRWKLYDFEETKCRYRIGRQHQRQIGNGLLKYHEHLHVYLKKIKKSRRREKPHTQTPIMILASKHFANSSLTCIHTIRFATYYSMCAAGKPFHMKHTRILAHNM